MANEPPVTGNIADLINDIWGKNGSTINIISSAFGAAADVAGAVTGVIALVNGIKSLFEEDPTQEALQAILTTIQNDFAQLNAADKAGRIIQKLQNLDNITGPAETQLQQLQAKMPTDIGQCLTAINELAINPDAISNWQAVFSDQIFWTDAGQYFQFKNIEVSPFGQTATALDAGYGQQTPPEVGADLVFSYLYVLPDFLRTLAIFIAVAGTDDPDWVTDYGPQVLQPVAAFLKNNVHDTIASAITQLSPGSWDGQTLWKAIGVSPVEGPSTPSGKWPWQGVSAIPAVPRSVTVLSKDPPPPLIEPPIPTATGANLEFGAVEKYSGYSSMGDYQISFQDIPSNSPDPAPFNKFQIRLLKRAIDVYIGVGLLQLWNAINNLNALVGAPPAPRHPLNGWSFHKILQMSEIRPDPVTQRLSLYGLAGFLKHTQPLDTDQTAPMTSFQELLSH
jgi:hypothetical protein